MSAIKVTLAILLGGLLAACDSPSVAFMGSGKTIVVIEGSRFSVHQREDSVEVYRTSFEFLPPRARVLYLAEMAIEQATGCAVKSGSLMGDQALIKANLACGAQSQSWPLPSNQRYECSLTDHASDPASNGLADRLECVLGEV